MNGCAGMNEINREIYPECIQKHMDKVQEEFADKPKEEDAAGKARTVEDWLAYHDHNNTGLDFLLCRIYEAGIFSENSGICLFFHVFCLCIMTVF